MFINHYLFRLGIILLVLDRVKKLKKHFEKANKETIERGRLGLWCLFFDQIKTKGLRLVLEKQFASDFSMVCQQSYCCLLKNLYSLNADWQFFDSNTKKQIQDLLLFNDTLTFVELMPTKILYLINQQFSSFDLENLGLSNKTILRSLKKNLRESQAQANLIKSMYLGKTCFNACFHNIELIAFLSGYSSFEVYSILKKAEALTETDDFLSIAI